MVASVFFALLISYVTAQITCLSKRSATSTSGPLTVTAVLCADDDMIYLDIVYPTYNENWFGIVLGSGTMLGDALVFTSGKSTEVVRSEALYAYENTAKNMAAVTYVPENNWDSYFQDFFDTRGMRIIYRTALNNTDFTLDVESIEWAYAIDNSGGLVINGKHTGLYSDRNAPPMLTFSSDEPSTTMLEPPTTSVDMETSFSTSSWDDEQDVCEDGVMSVVTPLDELSIALTLCSDGLAYLDVWYMGSDENWIGVVLDSDIMLGDAVVWTTGKEGERELGLYAYVNTARSLTGVSYNEAENWTEFYVSQDDNGVRFVYTKLLADLGWTMDTEMVNFGYAIGEGYAVNQYHNVADEGGRMFTFGPDIETTSVEDDSAASKYGIVALIVAVGIHLVRM